VTRKARPCAVPGCGSWAMRGELLCRSHNRSDRGSQPVAQTPAGTQHQFYAGLFTKQELEDIARQLEVAERSLEMEVAVMRVLIRRVMEGIGQKDPLKALPLIRQGVDAICRALRTERVLTGEASDSLAAAFAVAVREIAGELDIDDQRPQTGD
jgi:hypothetical protein